MHCKYGSCTSRSRSPSARTAGASTSAWLNSARPECKQSVIVNGQLQNAHLRLFACHRMSLFPHTRKQAPQSRSQCAARSRRDDPRLRPTPRRAAFESRPSAACAPHLRLVKPLYAAAAIDERCVVAVGAFALALMIPNLLGRRRDQRDRQSHAKAPHRR